MTLPGLAITVDDPRTADKYGPLVGHATYRIASHHPLANASCRHRFSEFVALRAALLDAIPGAVLPPLPEKVITMNKFEAGFLAKRAGALAEFLTQLAAHPLAMGSRELAAFLCWPQPLALLVQEHAASCPTPPLEGPGGDGESDADQLVGAEAQLMGERDDLEAARVVLKRLSRHQRELSTDTFLFGKVCHTIAASDIGQELQPSFSRLGHRMGNVAAALQAQAAANAESVLLLMLRRHSRLAAAGLEQLNLRRRLGEKLATTIRRQAEVQTREVRENKDARRVKLAEEGRRLADAVAELRAAYSAFTATLKWALARQQLIKCQDLTRAMRDFAASNEFGANGAHVAWTDLACGMKARHGYAEQGGDGGDGGAAAQFAAPSGLADEEQVAPATPG